MNTIKNAIINVSVLFGFLFTVPVIDGKTPWYLAGTIVFVLVVPLLVLLVGKIASMPGKGLKKVSTYFSIDNRYVRKRALELAKMKKHFIAAKDERDFQQMSNDPNLGGFANNKGIKHLDSKIKFLDTKLDFKKNNKKNK